MKYVDYKAKQQKEFNKLPMKAAFGDKQFEEMMAEWGLTTSKEDLEKICSIGAGAYCLKKDYHLFIEFGERSVKEDEEFYSNDENLKDALIYEFGNHECGYTWEFENGIIALGFSVKEFFSDQRKAKVFAEARKEYIDKLEG